MRKYRCITTIVVSLFLFNCSELYLSTWNCTEEDGRECDQAGNVDWLRKKALDVLIVMDTSLEGQELNPLVTNNLGQFLACIEPAVDWRIGIVSGVEDESFPQQLGALTGLEIEGQISTQTVIHPRMKNYKQVFSDTISLKSGCLYPPYCIDGAIKPLTAVATFMKRYSKPQSPFLRKYASLAAIIISPSDEEKQSSASTPAQTALKEVYAHYKVNEFVGLAVTDSGTVNDCVSSSVDYVHDGLDFVQQGGDIYATGSVLGVFTPINPLALLAITLLPEFAKGQLVADKKLMELMKFAKDTGGHVFDICKPHYGRALAYSILEKMNMENRFPSECKSLPSKSDQKFAEK